MTFVDVDHRKWYTCLVRHGIVTLVSPCAIVMEIVFPWDHVGFPLGA